MALLDRLIELALLPGEALPRSALSMARSSLFDWMVCGRAGSGQPLAQKLREFAVGEGGKPVASMFGGAMAPPRMAALVNGATSHALDYDDTHFGHVGHLSVGIYPAAVAVGEEIGASRRDVVEAFLVGAEAAVRIGKLLGNAHYNRGFHQTATAGGFGATLAAGRLYGLSADRMRQAVGLCATRSSGLKSQFGTMGKAYNAGIAAANGVEAAQLARLDFTSADDGLMGPQGFVDTHSDDPDQDGAWADPPPETFLFEDNKYKLHACCHGLHAMIEALLTAMRTQALSADAVAAFSLRTNPRWLRVCNIQTPRTGLEVKFSYGWLAGMVLSGIPTGNDRIYTDELAARPALKSFAEKVTVAGDDTLSDLQAEGRLTMKDGSIVPISHDLSLKPTPDALERSLREKAAAVLGGRGEDIWQALTAGQGQSAADLGRLIRA